MTDVCFLFVAGLSRNIPVCSRAPLQDIEVDDQCSQPQLLQWCALIGSLYDIEVCLVLLVVSALYGRLLLFILAGARFQWFVPGRPFALCAHWLLPPNHGAVFPSEAGMARTPLSRLL